MRSAFYISLIFFLVSYGFCATSDTSLDNQPISQVDNSLETDSVQNTVQSESPNLGPREKAEDSTQGDYLRNENAAATPVDSLQDIEANNKSTVDNKSKRDDENAYVTLSYSVHKLTPIKIVLSVNVSHPTTVWCEAVLPGSQFLPSNVMKSRPGQLIRKSKQVRISDLRPNTLYNVYCFGNSEFGEMAETALSSLSKVRTLQSILAIKNERIWNNMVAFELESNIPKDAVCVLFNDLSKEIDSMRTDSSPYRAIRFRSIDPSRRYFVQCAIVGDGSELAKTEITSVSTQPKRVSYWGTIVKILIIGLLMVIGGLLGAIAFYRRKRLSLFEVDDQESVRLLNRKPRMSEVSEQSVEDNQYLKELSQGKSCPRCGYINPPSLSSCLECRAILK